MPFEVLLRYRKENYLEVNKKVVKLLLVASSIEVNATGVEDGTNEPNAK
jgi:hypothetical protein